ncbi:MAG: hypothetical protein M3O71_32195 [Bacteroidota bacterium]|nr:hypothetical protein [Bacteroidota bacterium]
MKFSALIILFLFAIAGTERGRFAESASTRADTTGVLISKIEFELKATQEDLKIFEDGIVPWISIENPSNGIDSLIDADEIVLPFSQATLIIDYPLRKPVTFDLATENGFSRKQLIMLISEKYHEIYKGEETTASTKTVRADERKDLLNRNETNGKYGIWGHDLSDLDLGTIEVHETSSGKIYLVLDIES